MAEKNKKNIRNLNLAELQVILERLGEPSYRAKQLFKWLYFKGLRRRVNSFDGFSDLPLGLRHKLTGKFSLEIPAIAECRTSADGTSKFLFCLEDGNYIESVLIPSDKRLTICISTQVGCKFGCVFCASGAYGFRRHLNPAEMLGQILAVSWADNRNLTNYVFMGMGEPLDNFDNLERTLLIMTSKDGLDIAPRRITVSTVGIIAGIKKFIDSGLCVNLSISLHAVTDRLRSELMPINSRYPLEKLINAAEDFTRKRRGKLTLEYVLFQGINDTLADADGLAAIARRLKTKINLIPASPIVGLRFRGPTEANLGRFCRWLEERKVHVTVRLSKGSDIEASCGQLAGRFLT